jgi:hypothetical protein
MVFHQFNEICEGSVKFNAYEEIFPRDIRLVQLIVFFTGRTMRVNDSRINSLIFFSGIITTVLFVTGRVLREKPYRQIKH